MSDTQESLRHTIEGASELESVVRTMKALAASSIVQYERAVLSLDEYYRTVALGLHACFAVPGVAGKGESLSDHHASSQVTGAVVFGSDQGLVGQFNEVLADFVVESLGGMPGNKLLWVVGERLQGRLNDAALPITASLAVPNSIFAITPLVGRILIEVEAARERGAVDKVYLFHIKPGVVQEPVMQRLLPLDDVWRREQSMLSWPGRNLPEVMGKGATLQALMSEYLFISLYRACAESLASENASRLAAMRRAEKNIEELLIDLNQDFNRLRQTAIDEELFDVIAGYELLSPKR